MPWWELAVDIVPVVGTVYRTGKAITAHIEGDHERAAEEWINAGMNVASDAIGLATGGVGKVATAAVSTGGKIVVKVAAQQGVKAVSKQVIKHTVKQGSRAAARSARKQVTKKALKKHGKKYVKKKVKKATKKAKEKAFNGEDSEDEQEDEELHYSGDHWKDCKQSAGKVATAAFKTAVNVGTKNGGKAASRKVFKQVVKKGTHAAVGSAKKQVTSIQLKNMLKN